MAKKSIETLQEEAQRAELTARTKAARARCRAADASARFSKDHKKFMAMSGGFTAAKRTRLNSANRPHRGGSADSWRDEHELGELRRRANHAYRNSIVARPLVDRSADIVVGTGFTAQAASGDKDFDQEAERLFATWAGGGGIYESREGRRSVMGCDIRGQQTLHEMARSAWISTFLDGGELVIPLTFGQLQVVEHERLVNPGHKPNDETFTSGVEHDGYGRPTTYHVGRYMHAGIFVDASDPEQVPALAAGGEAFLFNRPVLPNQTVCEPRLAASIDEIDRLDRYILSTEEAAYIATCFGLIEKTESPDLLAGSLPNKDQSRTDGWAGGYREVEVEPGMYKQIGLGDQIEQIKPEHPTTVFQEFVKQRLRMIGSNIGLPLEIFGLDFTETNFASAKSAVEIAFCGLATEQRVVSDGFYKRIYRFKIAQWIRQGLLKRVKDWDKVEFIAPKRPSLDPLNDAKAVEILLNRNLTTVRREVARLHGADWIEIMDQRQRERQMERDKDIVAITAPGAKATDEAVTTEAAGGNGDGGDDA